MTPIELFKTIFQPFKGIAPVPTSGILTVVFLSCVLFGVKTYFDLTQSVFSVDASVFLNGHLHRLFTYPFYHQTAIQLLLSATALAFLGASMEKGFGTLRFLFLFHLLSAIIGLFYSFLDLLQGDGGHRQAQGLLSVALACVAVTTMHTKMTKGFLCGVSFPTMALPWLLLMITTVLTPHSVLPCNIIAILVGWMYGKGWFALVDLSEARAGALEKMMPFRMLRRMTRVTFVPASTEERRNTILPKISPSPGSYPVQAYAPLSSINTADTTPKFVEGWPNMTSPFSTPTPPLNLIGPGSGHGFGPNHEHGSKQNLGLSYNHHHGQL